jgi:cell wall-associated NlpC family hydrolase
MSFTKKHLVLIPFLTLFFNIGYSQIITSKKIAIQKGVYQKPTDLKKAELEVDKSSKKQVITETKTKDVFIPKENRVLKNTVASSKSKKVIINDKEDDDLILSPAQNYFANQLINNAIAFIGVKYHGGGTSRSGMDCSGMVTAVFNIFDFKLPRSSHDMSNVGEKRDEKDIEKGDLIFFKTNGRKIINHVGIVVEVLADEIKFIHSASSKGVTISSTREPYYKKAFAQVNKVLQ